MKIAIIQYSTYGHITTLAKAVQEGVEKAGYKADLFQIPETLPQNVLDQIHAPPKPKEIPIATLETLTSYDAFLFGVPTRFGTGPAQLFDYWAATGGLWAQGALDGKPAGVFVSTGTQGGGQETTVRNTLNFLVHHGLIYVPLGYAKAFQYQANLDEIHGGSPYGAGTLAAGDGSRQPSELELKIATIQGESFAQTAARFVDGAEAAAAKENKKKEQVPTESNKAAAPNTTTTTTTAPTEKAADGAASSAPAPAQQRAAQQTTKAPESTDKSFCSKCTIM
ncbi:YCP4 [Candida oxycetoniae]|uniref:YCP4 n=1 Tax=Candida oxycetoniae TaxID=497107 RepID=A0AAI9T069_9ASCO|nr:YCP4 [Candida oxycetoniae]KAI3405954.1 YCP4 [Candida oxycetoniae]